MNTDDLSTTFSVLIEIGRGRKEKELFRTIRKNQALLMRITSVQVWLDRPDYFDATEAAYREISKLSNREFYDLLRGVATIGSPLTSSVGCGAWFANLFSMRCPELYEEASEWLNEKGIGHYYFQLSHSPFYDYEERCHLTEEECSVVRQRIQREQKLDRQRAADARQRIAEEEETARVRRAERAAAARENRRLNLEQQAARQNIRNLRLEELVAIEPVRRLVAIVGDLSVGLDFFPSDWGMLVAEQRRKVPAATVTLLLKRSRQRTGKKWRSVGTLFRGDVLPSHG